MKVEIYKSYGVLAHEKQPVYTWGAPASDIYDQITVELPYCVGANALDEPLLELDGTRYLLGDVLTNWGDSPALAWFDGQSNRHKMLTVVESLEV